MRAPFENSNQADGRKRDALTGSYPAAFVLRI